MRREFFNSLADSWDDLVPPGAASKLAEIVAASGLQKGAHVLDVGCGTGLLVPFLLETVGERGTVTGVDFAAAMVQRAGAKAFGPNVRFVEADVAALPFEPGTFDAVFCNNVLPHLPDKPGALQELNRVLKPGGLLVICHTESREAVNRMHRHIGGPVGADLLPTVEELRQMLLDTGYSVLDLVDGADRFVVRAVKPGTTAPKKVRMYCSDVRRPG
ncbi:MAG: class I SAM-dependent methyltransferase [Bacillota bacterium]